MSHDENPMKTFGTFRPASGFTLIELMVTVAIVAILAAVALPAYKEQVSRGKRADVQAALVEDAAYMQRYYSANNTYTDSTNPPVLPVQQSPRTDIANYAITMTPNNPATTGFLLVATRAGTMASDSCGNFTYDNLGQKNLQNPTNGKTVASCWR
jgi:type IV pilus assembly protein PilE